MRLPHPTRLTAVLSVALLSLSLVACSDDGDPTPPSSTPASTPSTPAPTSSALPTVTVTSTPTEAAPTETAGTTGTAGTTAASTSTAKNGLPRDVAKVQKIFASVAPMSLFQQFTACNDSISNAWECSGPEVGQFQFFDSMSKAASTTQLITELRSSRVVEDTGRKVVGWSTLGTTAVITVVDNDKGLVMQQMVSSDRVDPEERIYELGLAERPAPERVEAEH